MSFLKQTARRTGSASNGQTVAEYALICVFVSIVGLALYQTGGTIVTNLLQPLASYL